MAHTFKAATAALYNILDGYAGLSQFEVVYGGPQFYESHKTIGVGGMEPEETEPAALGANQFRERYALIVEIMVEEGGTGSAAAKLVTEAGYDAIEQVRAAVLADKTLGGVPDLHYALPGAPDTPGGAPAFISDTGDWTFFVRLPIRCLGTIA